MRRRAANHSYIERKIEKQRGEKKKNTSFAQSGMMMNRKTFTSEK